MDRPTTAKEKAKITAGAVAALVIVGWMAYPRHRSSRRPLRYTLAVSIEPQMILPQLLPLDAAKRAVGQPLWRRPIIDDMQRKAFA